MYLAFTPNDLITIYGVTSLMSGLLPHVQCGYTETSVVYACPHWPSANNDSRHAWQLVIHVFTFSFEIYRCQALTY